MIVFPAFLKWKSFLLGPPSLIWRGFFLENFGQKESAVCAYFDKMLRIII